MGKTLLINDLLADQGTSHRQVAQLVSTQLDADQIIHAVSHAFGLSCSDRDTTALKQELNRFFKDTHEKKRYPLLIVDEAQNLHVDAKEELLRLADTRLNGQPLLQVIFVYQSLARKNDQLPRIAQRFGSPVKNLEPLTGDQTSSYIFHRLKAAGWSNNPRIDDAAIQLVSAACQGIPRVINQFCSRLLLLGAMENKVQLSSKDARAVYQEMLEENLYVAPLPADFVDDAQINTEEPELIAVPLGALKRKEQSGVREKAAVRATSAPLSVEPSPLSPNQILKPAMKLVRKVESSEAKPAALKVEQPVVQSQHSSPASASEAKWLDVKSWAAATSGLPRSPRARVTTAQQLDRAHRQLQAKKSDARHQLPDQKRGETPRISISDNRVESTVTFLMALVAIAGLVALFMVR